MAQAMRKDSDGPDLDTPKAVKDFLLVLRNQKDNLVEAMENEEESIRSGKISLLRGVERKQYYSSLLSKYERQLSRSVGDDESFPELEEIVEILDMLVKMWDKALKSRSTKLLSATDLGSVVKTAGRGLKIRAKEKLEDIVEGVIGKSTVTRSITSAITNRLEGGNAISRALRSTVGASSIAPSMLKASRPTTASSSDMTDEEIEDVTEASISSASSVVTSSSNAIPMEMALESASPIQANGMVDAVGGLSDNSNIVPFPMSRRKFSVADTPSFLDIKGLSLEPPSIENIASIPTSGDVAVDTVANLSRMDIDQSSTKGFDNVVRAFETNAIKPKDLPASFDYQKFFGMQALAVEEQWELEMVFFRNEFEEIREILGDVSQAAGGKNEGLLGALATGIGGFLGFKTVKGLSGGMHGPSLPGGKVGGRFGGRIGGLARVLGLGGAATALGAGVSNASNAIGTGAKTALNVAKTAPIIGPTVTSASSSVANSVTKVANAAKPAVEATRGAISAVANNPVVQRAASSASSASSSITRGASRAAASVGKFGGAFAKVLGPVGLVFAGYEAWAQVEDLYAQRAAGNITDEEFKTSVGGIVGGMLGGLAGATILGQLAAAGGSVILPGIGTLAGGLLGGVVGYYGGEAIGSKLGEFMVDTALGSMGRGTRASDIDPEAMLGNTTSLSSKYESGGRGYAAIGNDSTGGYSYGKYQLASQQGSVAEFIKHLEETNPELYAQLQAAGGDQAARAGTQEFRDTWERLSADQGFRDAQDSYVKQQYLAPALATAENMGLSSTTMSDTLKSVLFSTSIQHGAGGTQSILKAVERKAGMSIGEIPEADLITMIYEERSTRFGSSTPEVREAVINRFVNEHADAQAMLVAESAQPTETQMAMNETDVRVPTPPEGTTMATLNDSPSAPSAAGDPEYADYNVQQVASSNVVDNTTTSSISSVDTLAERTPTPSAMQIPTEQGPSKPSNNVRRQSNGGGGGRGGAAPSDDDIPTSPFGWFGGMAMNFDTAF